MEPEWASCLKTWVCWDFRSVPLYPATFRSFHLCIFSFLFSSFIYLFSSLHNLYTYCNLLMFFLDFTSITCSLSPLSYFWWECMPVYVFVCSCVHVLWRSEGSLHCQSSAAFLFETVSLMTWSFGSSICVLSIGITHVPSCLHGFWADELGSLCLQSTLPTEAFLQSPLVYFWYFDLSANLSLVVPSVSEQ